MRHFLWLNFYFQIYVLDEIQPEKIRRRDLAEICHARISEVCETSAMTYRDYPIDIKEVQHNLLS